MQRAVLGGKIEVWKLWTELQQRVRQVPQKYDGDL